MAREFTPPKAESKSMLGSATLSTSFDECFLNVATKGESYLLKTDVKI